MNKKFRPKGRLSASARTRIRRVPSRGHYDPDTIFAVLDDAFLCHVSYVEDQYPTTVPMLYGRRDDHLLLHGSTASRTIRALAAGTEVCIVVTLLEGIVFARSVFNHSANYRSVVIYGTPSPIERTENKLAALKAISDHLAPGRWEESRAPSDKELQATSVIEIPLDEASAKIRTGGPIDDERDVDFPTWAGHVPVATLPEEPISDPRTTIPVSDPVRDFVDRRRRRGTGPQSRKEDR